jgi:hypothetical protein
MAKKAHLFNDFDTPNGSYNLFQNAMRKAIDYDANISDIFEAKVLTRPTLVTRQPSNVRFQASGDKTETFAFMARILGTNSPHRFLEDPCGIKDTKRVESRRKVFNLIQMHTKVFIQTNSPSPLPEIGDIVKLKLERGSYGSFKTDRAEFVKEESKGKEDNKLKQDCVSVASSFKKDDFKPISSYTAKSTKMVYNGVTLGVSGVAKRGAMVENGRLPEEILYTVEQGLALTNYNLPAPLLGIPTHDSKGRPIKFIKEAIVPFIELAINYYKEENKILSISDSYRTYERQVEMKTAAATAAYAAVPGTSNHGWGVAFDVNGTYSDTDKDGKSSFEERKRTEVYKWLSRNGNGFINPESIREGWHWENVGVRDQIYELPIQGADLIGNDSTETPPEEASNG